MLATEVKGLRVEYCRSYAAPASKMQGNDDGRWAWRILITGPYAVFPVMFARERDAEAGMRAIADLGDWENDWDSIVVAKAAEIRERIAGAMQW